MKITILGSGSAYGVPSVGGYWGDCDPSNLKNARTAPSILIESDTTKILVDMSPDYRQQSITHSIQRLDAVLFTHEHADHIMGNFHIPKMMMHQEQDLPLYALPEAGLGIQKVFHYQYDSTKLAKFSGKARPVWREIVPYKELTIGDITILPLLQDHGRIKSLGFRIGNFAYSTDFNDFPPETYDALSGLDTWLVECNSLHHKPNSPEIKHQYLENILGFVERVSPKHTLLTHMDTSMDFDKVTAMLPPHIRLAYDGMVLEF